MTGTFALALIAALVVLGTCAGYALGHRDGITTGREAGYREGYLRSARQ
jgi:hypothetical protein